ncbi:hypothetical protein SDC9_195698 [bioreactor metagenome]|uniref:Uncharacterized protein n=1 Tax=bioreactor metagenome TaxID=1076179 RepID=A0A645IIF5_9ZZZZ
MHGLEDCNQHFLLTVHAVEIPAALDVFSHAQIVQHALTVEVRRPRAVAAPTDAEVHLQIIIHPANGVDQLFDGRHGHGVVVVHGVNVANHPVRRFTGF